MVQHSSWKSLKGKKELDFNYVGKSLYYLFQARAQLSSDKNFPRNIQTYINAFKSAEKAFKPISALYNLREESSTLNIPPVTATDSNKDEQKPPGDYQILLAPFYYYMGHILASFIEEHTDEYGNLPELNVAQSDDE